MLRLGHKNLLFFCDELACAIRDINVGYILVCGDFNWFVFVLFFIVDIITREQHVERVVLKFNDLLSDCDLHDTWSLFHPEGKEHTWCKKNILFFLFLFLQNH